MSPSNALHDHRYVGVTVPKFFGYFSDCFSGIGHISHFYNLFRREFTFPLLSNSHSPFRNHICVVFGFCAEKHVARPNTAWNIALMAAVETVWNWAVGSDPRPSVGEHGDVSCWVERPITFSPWHPRPKPAGFCFVYLLPESFRNWLCWFWHSINLATQPVSVNTLLTTATAITGT